MTSSTAIGVAACLQIVLRTSLFLEQSKDLCSPAPSVSSWIFLIAFLDLLSDFCIYPMRYMHIPYFCQVIVEIVITILLTEFSAIIVWCTIEKLSCRLVKSALFIMGMSPATYARWESVILGVATSAISLSMLLYVGEATDHIHVLRKKISRLERKISHNIWSLWNYFSLSGGSGRRRCCAQECCCCDEDGYMCCGKRRRRRRRCR